MIISLRPNLVLRSSYPAIFEKLILIVERAGSLIKKRNLPNLLKKNTRPSWQKAKLAEYQLILSTTAIKPSS